MYKHVTSCAPVLSRLLGPATITGPLCLFKLVQVLEPREHDLLASLLDLAGEEDLVEDGVDLVEVEYEVELAHVAEEGVQDLDEEVDGLQIRQLVVVGVYARAEEQAGVSPVYDLVVPELDEVGLVFLVAGCYEAMDLRQEEGSLLVGCLEHWHLDTGNKSEWREPG